MRKKLTCKFLKTTGKRIGCKFQRKESNQNNSVNTVLRETSELPLLSIVTIEIPGQMGAERVITKHASSLEAAPICFGHKLNQIFHQSDS